MKWGFFGFLEENDGATIYGRNPEMKQRKYKFRNKVYFFLHISPT